MEPLREPIRIFCSYAHRDLSLIQAFKLHLKLLERARNIIIWSEDDISPGANREAEAYRHLVEAQISLFFLSADFFASSSCLEHLQAALSFYQTGNMRIIPILLRPVAWQESPLVRFQALPKNAMPLTQWQNLDEAIFNVVKDIDRVCDDILRASRNRSKENDMVTPKGLLYPPERSSQKSERAQQGGETILSSILGRLLIPFQRGPKKSAQSEVSDQPQGAYTSNQKYSYTYQIYEVFVKSGVPHITFVEREDFGLLKLALSQLGRGVVIEGPSGIGKTTAIKKAIEELIRNLHSPQPILGINASVSMLSARDPADRDRLKTLSSWHSGTVIIDDFHRLSSSTSIEIVDYMKYLADTEPEGKKLVVIGIPQSGQTLVDLSFDVATRIDVFRWGKVKDDLISQMIEKGEKALNIEFNRKNEIVLAANGSLNIAQFLCFNICQENGIIKTQKRLQTVDCDIRGAASRVQTDLLRKFGKPIRHFAAMGSNKNSICLKLLEELAHCNDGFLSLPVLQVRRPDLTYGIEQFLSEKWMDKFYIEYPDCINHLFFDPSIQALVVDDPQLTFYLNEIYFPALAREVGKIVELTESYRPKIFISYSHRDVKWMERILVHLKPLEQRGVIDIWNDSKIGPGTRWKEEIQVAVKSSTIAVILVSADFLASDFIAEYELPQLLSRAETEGTTILPVIVSSCLFKGSGMDIFQSLNPPEKPLSEMTSSLREKTLVRLAEAISENIL